MVPDKSERKDQASEDQPSSNGVESKPEARTMEEELAAIHEAFERGKLRRMRVAESAGNDKGFFMEFLQKR
jgi:hypothetical protein